MVANVSRPQSKPPSEIEYIHVALPNQKNWKPHECVLLVEPDTAKVYMPLSVLIKIDGYPSPQQLSNQLGVEVVRSDEGHYYVPAHLAAKIFPDSAAMVPEIILIGLRGAVTALYQSLKAKET